MSSSMQAPSLRWIDARRNTIWPFASTAKRIGADRVIWGTDFPHPDTTYPGFIAELKESLTEFDSADQKKILSTNAATLYGL